MESQPAEVPVISFETTFFESPLIDALMENRSSERCPNKCIFVENENR